MPTDSNLKVKVAVELGCPNKASQIWNQNFFGLIAYLAASSLNLLLSWRILSQSSHSFCNL